MADRSGTREGGCTCGQVRYRMTSAPLIVHCCHCSKCQKQTGSAFATNALIEADRVELISGKVEDTAVDTPGGSGQRIARCPNCRVAVWSEYLAMTAGIPDQLYFVRVGTLDDPASLPPDVHIYTSTRLPWVNLPANSPMFEEYYVTKDVWSPESLARLAIMRTRIKELRG